MYVVVALEDTEVVTEVDKLDVWLVVKLVVIVVDVVSVDVRDVVKVVLWLVVDEEVPMEG